MAAEGRELFRWEGGAVEDAEGGTLRVTYRSGSPEATATKLVRALLSRIAELEGERDRAREDAERRALIVRAYREQEERAIQDARRSRDEQIAEDRERRRLLDAFGPSGDTGKATTETKR